MKNKRFLLALFSLVVNAAIVRGYDACIDGIYYNFSDTVASVTLGSQYYSGDELIPSYVTYDGKTYTVTSIGDYAFYKCTGLTSITIPKSVTNIGDHAFFNCTGLTSVTIPESVTNIGSSAFANCSELTSIIIPESVASIGYCAFQNTKWYNDWYNEQPEGLVYLGKCLYTYKGTMPNGTNIVLDEETIGITGCAFYGCSGLTSITIPESVTSIGDGTFGGCTGLTSITIPKSVTSIGESAFSGCTGITSITIPKSVTSIGDGTFGGCTGLASITIPKSVTSIGSYAFYGCTGITSITIPESVTTIGESAFSGCTGITSITIPESVITIGESAFSGCTGLTSVTINSKTISYSLSGAFGPEIEDYILGESVTSIEEGAFYGCTGLTSITIPESVTSIVPGTFDDTKLYNDHSDGPVYIGNWLYAYKGTMPNGTNFVVEEGTVGIADEAFLDCSGMISVTIPKTVKYIGVDAFKDCTGLASVSISDLSAWFEIDFGNNTANPLSYAPKVLLNGEEITMDGDFVIPDNVTHIGNYVFYGCAGMTSVSLPDGLETIGDYAFYGCNHLSSVTIPKGVTRIGESAFYGCRGLQTVNILEGVTHIGPSAFTNCGGLQTVVISEGLTHIGESAFYGCGSLQTIYIPASLTDIDWDAFFGCYSLHYVDITNLANWCKISFAGENSNPLSFAHQLYLNDVRISDLVIPDDVSSISDYAFYRCRGLTSITISESVTSIGEKTFAYCSAASITIAGNVINIGNSAFQECSNLTSVSISEGDTYIGEGAFSRCTNLTSVLLPDGLVSIGSRAFSECYSLASIIIPRSVETIGSGAFDYCSKLVKIIVLPIDPPSLGGYAFSNVSSSCLIYIPKASSRAYRLNEQWKEYDYMMREYEGPTVLDEASLTPPAASEGFVELVVKRTIKAGVWNTLCLPFNMTTSQLKEAFGADVQLAEFKSYDAEYGDDNSVTGITVNFEGVDLNKGLYANYPYLIKTSKEVSEISLTAQVNPDEESAVAEYKKGNEREAYGRFIGTLHAGETVPADNLFVKDNKFYYSTGITTIKAFRAYLWLDDVLSDASLSVGLSIRVDGDITHVEEMTTAADDADVYDLSGRKVQSGMDLERGVYIIGGKKIIVR